MKKRLLCSFSGGRTSAFMTNWLLDNCANEYDIKVVFSNTGQEHQKTLEFIKRCDDELGFGTAWVEAVVYQNERRSSSHKIVTFETASRAGEPFESIIQKYGIPNIAFPHCTRELKLRPIRSYMNSIGWETGSYETAIGIRIDETRRVKKDAKKAKISYPLIDIIPTDKQDVNDWWEEQSFNLEIPEHHGNCTWCWKKSLSKHFKLISESPEIYDFPRRMEELHGRTGAGSSKGESRVFFRNFISTNDLFKAAEIADNSAMGKMQMDLDLNGGCSESCEVYAMENLS